MTTYAWGPGDGKKSKIFCIKVAPIEVPAPPMSTDVRPRKSHSNAVMLGTTTAPGALPPCRCPLTPTAEVQRGIKFLVDSASRLESVGTQIDHQMKHPSHQIVNAHTSKRSTVQNVTVTPVKVISKLNVDDTIAESSFSVPSMKVPILPLIEESWTRPSSGRLRPDSPRPLTKKLSTLRKRSFFSNVRT